MGKVESICKEYLRTQSTAQAKKPKRLGKGFDEILKSEMRAIKERTNGKH